MRGASETLKQDRPALLIEVSQDPDDPESTAAALFHLLGRLGYQANAWDDHRVRARIRGEHQVDYLFLTADHLRFLSARQLVLVK